MRPGLGCLAGWPNASDDRAAWQAHLALASASLGSFGAGLHRQILSELCAATRSRRH